MASTSKERTQRSHPLNLMLRECTARTAVSVSSLNFMWPVPLALHEAKFLPLLLCIVGLNGSALGQCQANELVGSGGQIGDRFGVSVSLDDDVAVVGAPGANDNMGAAYVLRRDGETWTQEAFLTAPVPDSDDSFGQSIAVQADTLLVGAPRRSAPLVHSGAVYVYRLDPGGPRWILDAQITASDGGAGDNFGGSVSIDGNVALIGALEDNINGLQEAGSAYVFRWNGDHWIEEAKLTDSRAAAFDYFGSAVAVLGDFAVAGAKGKDHPHVGKGSVFVFRYDGATWVLECELTAFDGVGNQLFGGAVSIAGNIICVGADQDNDQMGAAYIFRYDGASWLPEEKLTGSMPVGPFPQFGSEVSMTDNAKIVVVGAPSDLAQGLTSGAAYLFRDEGNSWEEVTKLTPSNGAKLDVFGRAVAVDQDTAFVGAPRQNECCFGSAYEFVGAAGFDCNDNTEPDACDILNRTSTDLNQNDIPDECEAMGDLNGDGRVGIVDFLILIGSWGECDAPCPPICNGDLDGDCNVESLDFLLLLGNWG